MGISIKKLWNDLKTQKPKGVAKNIEKPDIKDVTTTMQTKVSACRNLSVITASFETTLKKFNFKYYKELVKSTYSKQASSCKSRKEFEKYFKNSTKTIITMINEAEKLYNSYPSKYGKSNNSETSSDSKALADSFKKPGILKKVYDLSEKLKPGVDVSDIEIEIPDPNDNDSSFIFDLGNCKFFFLMLLLYKVMDIKNLVNQLIYNMQVYAADNPASSVLKKLKSAVLSKTKAMLKVGNKVFKMPDEFFKFCAEYVTEPLPYYDAVIGTIIEQEASSGNVSNKEQELTISNFGEVWQSFYKRENYKEQMKDCNDIIKKCSYIVSSCRDFDNKYKNIKKKHTAAENLKAFEYLIDNFKTFKGKTPKDLKDMPSSDLKDVLVAYLEKKFIVNEINAFIAECQKNTNLKVVLKPSERKASYGNFSTAPKETEEFLKKVQGELNKVANHKNREKHDEAIEAILQKNTDELYSKIRKNAEDGRKNIKSINIAEMYGKILENVKNSKMENENTNIKIYIQNEVEALSKKLKEVIKGKNKIESINDDNIRVEKPNKNNPKRTVGERNFQLINDLKKRGKKVTEKEITELAEYMLSGHLAKNAAPSDRYLNDQIDKAKESFENYLKSKRGSNAYYKKFTESDSYTNYINISNELNEMLSIKVEGIYDKLENCFVEDKPKKYISDFEKIYSYSTFKLNAISLAREIEADLHVVADYEVQNIWDRFYNQR